MYFYLYMWFTCHNCNGSGNRDDIPCIVCSRYNIYYNGVLTFYIIGICISLSQIKIKNLD